MLVLLVIAVGINYRSWGAVRVSAASRSRTGAFAGTLGLPLLCLFWSCSLLQPVAGCLGGGYFLWSIATGSATWAGHFDVLFQARLVLGAGESVAYPVFSKILVEYSPENRRGLANSLLEAAAKIGSAVTILLGGLFTARYGRAVALGFAGRC